MKMEGTLKNLLIFIIVCWIILAIIFGFTDLEISKAVINRESSWARFGRDFGEGPGYGIISISLAIFIGSFNEDIKKQKIPAYVIILIGLFFFILGFIIVDLWFVVFGGFISISLLILLLLTSNKDWTEFKTISIVIILLAIINPLLFVQITKILSGRVRFKNLAADYSNYTPWFLPPGPNLKNDSFPSGHTAMGWMLLPLLILIKDRKWNDPIKIFTIIIVFTWGLFIAISRVVIGDHYASDVLFSTGMAAVATIWLYNKFNIDKK